MSVVHIDVPNGSGLVTVLQDDAYVTWSAQTSVSSGRSDFDNKIKTLGYNFATHEGTYTYDFGSFVYIWEQTGGDAGDTSANIQINITIKRKSDEYVLLNRHYNVGTNRPVLETYIDFAIDSSTQKGYLVEASISEWGWTSPHQYEKSIGLTDLGNDFYVLLNPDRGGGAGSGYIGNSLLSNKKMVGYNVPTSSAEGTKTESVNDVSASAVSGKPKSGNGFARIKFLREVQGHIYSLSEQVVGTWVDNKTVYEKTYLVESLKFNNQWQTIDTILSFGRLVEVDVTILNANSGGIQHSNDRETINHRPQIQITNLGVIQYAFSGNGDEISFYLILRYTKN